MSRTVKIEIRETESRDIYGCVRREELYDFPKIVCLCGSTRFMEWFQAANLSETMKGNIVLSVGCNTKTDVTLSTMYPDWERTKVALDELHKRKIDLADEILVLNVGGYIGESTASEIKYAQDHGKPVRFLEPVEPEHFFAEPLCAFCNSPAHPGRRTCGRAVCVERDIERDVERIREQAGEEVEELRAEEVKR